MKGNVCVRDPTLHVHSNKAPSGEHFLFSPWKSPQQLLTWNRLSSRQRENSSKGCEEEDNVGWTESLPVSQYVCVCATLCVCEWWGGRVSFSPTVSQGPLNWGQQRQTNKRVESCQAEQRHTDPANVEMWHSEGWERDYYQPSITSERGKNNLKQRSIVWKLKNNTITLWCCQNVQ